MKEKDLPAKTRALEKLYTQFKAWRQARKKRSPHPRAPVESSSAIVPRAWRAQSRKSAAPQLLWIEETGLP